MSMKPWSDAESDPLYELMNELGIVESDDTPREAIKLAFEVKTEALASLRNQLKKKQEEASHWHQKHLETEAELVKARNLLDAKFEGEGTGSVVLIARAELEKLRAAKRAVTAYTHRLDRETP